MCSFAFFYYRGWFPVERLHGVHALLLLKHYSRFCCSVASVLQALPIVLRTFGKEHSRACKISKDMRNLRRIHEGIAGTGAQSTRNHIDLDRFRVHYNQEWHQVYSSNRVTIKRYIFVLLNLCSLKGVSFENTSTERVRLAGPELVFFLGILGVLVGDLSPRPQSCNAELQDAGLAVKGFQQVVRGNRRRRRAPGLRTALARCVYARMVLL